MKKLIFAILFFIPLLSYTQQWQVINTKKLCIDSLQNIAAMGEIMFWDNKYVDISSENESVWCGFVINGDTSNVYGLSLIRFTNHHFAFQSYDDGIIEFFALIHQVKKCDTISIVVKYYKEMKYLSYIYVDWNV